jgi:hypothetical protein
VANFILLKAKKFFCRINVINPKSLNHLMIKNKALSLLLNSFCRETQSSFTITRGESNRALPTKQNVPPQKTLRRERYALKNFF